MDIRKLEAFCKVYELQSFSKAGDELYLSQPTISSHVANLEAELCVKLFDRMGRKVMPTEAGHVLYRSAETVFKGMDQARAAIEMLRDKVVGELTVGCSTIPAHNIIPTLLHEFSSRYPDVRFTIHTSDSSEVIRRVAEGNWPVGIVGQMPSEDGLTAKLLMEDETVVVAAADAAWLPRNGEPIDMKIVAGMPWVMRFRGSGTRRVLEDGLAQVNLTLRDLNVRCRVDGTCEALAHTLAGVGVSVTSRLASESLIRSGDLVRLDVPELAGKRQFYLIYHSDRHMFPALKTFVDFAVGI